MKSGLQLSSLSINYLKTLRRQDCAIVANLQAVHEDISVSLRCPVSVSEFLVYFFVQISPLR